METNYSAGPKASCLVWTLLLVLTWMVFFAAQASAVPTESAALSNANNSQPGTNVVVTRDGMVYRNVRIQEVAPDGLVISYAPTNGGVGISRLKFKDLPGALQQRYGYNPANAAAFEKAELQSEGRLRAQLLAEDAEAESKLLANELFNAWSNARDSGTGFFITDNGYLLTCRHVVANATRITVGTRQGIFPAELVQSDATSDIALLKVDGNFASLPLATNGMELGESVFTLGFPNPGVQGMQPKLTRGEISSLAGVRDDPGEYQISVPVQPGNSGGALVDEYGNVAGIVAARLSDEAALLTSGMTAQDVNYAVKSSRVKALLETVPGLTVKLKSPRPPEDRKFEDVVQEAQDAAALVIVN
jgi:S1-C subfamily serine protease